MRIYFHRQFRIVTESVLTINRICSSLCSLTDKSTSIVIYSSSVQFSRPNHHLEHVLCIASPEILRRTAYTDSFLKFRVEIYVYNYKRKVRCQWFYPDFPRLACLYVCLFACFCQSLTCFAACMGKWGAESLGLFSCSRLSLLSAYWRR